MAKRDTKDRSIREILSRKKIPRFRFTTREQRIIAREQARIVDSLMKREVDALATHVLKPWLDLSKAVGETGHDSAFAKAMTKMRQQTLLHLGDFSDPRTPDGALTTLHKAASVSLCSGILSQPPYFFGNPLTESFGSGTAIPGFKTRSELAIPTEGALSVGAANGRITDDNIYPSRDSWLFGDANSADANIWHFVSPEVPLTMATRLEVTVDVAIGETTLINPVGLLSGSPDSFGSGLVGVLGVIYLSVFAKDSMRSSANRKRFLLRWQSELGNSDSGGSSGYLRSFSISQTLNLKPGETFILVIVGARLLAFRAGVNDPAGGFSGVDLRTPYSPTHPLWFGQPAGGPIRIPQISLTFCPLPVITQ